MKKRKAYIKEVEKLEKMVNISLLEDLLSIYTTIWIRIQKKQLKDVRRRNYEHRNFF